MSILIRGMEMPKEGTVFVIDSAGQVWSNEFPTRGYTRLDGVTAVPVPPHGRLIDADALVFKDDIYSWRDRKVIAAAPTIIPAEDGE